MDQQEALYESMEITGVMPDGTVAHYEVVGVFALDDERQYMALHPWDHPDASRVEIVPFEEGAEGEVEFREFESDEEYAAAEAAFYEMFQEEGGNWENE